MDREAFSEIRVVELEPTTACNRSCKFCAPGIEPGRREHPRTLDPAIAKGIFRELAALEYQHEICFCGWGEPTLSVTVEEMIRVAHEVVAQAKVVIHTNGDCGQAKIEQLLAETPVDEIRITNYEPGRSWKVFDDEPRVWLSDHAARRPRYHSRAGNIQRYLKYEERDIALARHRPCGRFRQSIFLAAEGYWVTCCNDMARLQRWGPGIEALFSDPLYLSLRETLTGSDVDRSVCAPCHNCFCWRFQG